MNQYFSDPKKLILFVAVSSLLWGCKDSTSSGIPGSMVGYVKVFDSATNHNDPGKIVSSEGVKISVDGTNFSTLSDVNGKWQLNNVFPGSYILSFTKIGIRD